MTPSTAIKENISEPAAIRTWVEGRFIFIELTDGRIIVIVGVIVGVTSGSGLTN